MIHERRLFALEPRVKIRTLDPVDPPSQEPIHIAQLFILQVAPGHLFKMRQAISLMQIIDIRDLADPLEKSAHISACNIRTLVNFFYRPHLALNALEVPKFPEDFFLHT
jgi:hypothetical protein